MDLELKARTIVVTGGSRGLGLAAARELVAEGAQVVIAGRDGSRAAEAAASLGGSAVGMAADTADPATPDRLIAAARDTFGNFDGILISTGGPAPGTAASSTEAQWRAALDSVFLGTVRLAQKAAEQLPEGGVVALVLSSSVYEPIPGLTISNGLRPGLAGYAKSLADEVGPRGIRVVGLLPYRIYTDRAREIDARSGDAQAARARNSADIPLRRYGTPEEFGKIAAFLLSPAASYLTGVMVPVDGGGLRSF
ncbi:SDR family oxidoreductase [Micromonospora sp. NPDC053740]|uniref:SDR family oxidoreductase n=1 Tax=Micromonospora sp. NPDC053740 TaxID=3155173 RepID=UPI003439D2CB